MLVWPLGLAPWVKLLSDGADSMKRLTVKAPSLREAIGKIRISILLLVLPSECQG